MKRARRALSGLDDDIREHIDLETQENIDRGMSPEEARRQALLKFGNVSLGNPERVSGLRVTQQLLPMLGAAPVIGRLFHSGDDKPGAEQTVVLSHGYWQLRFAGRPDIVGQSVRIENAPHTVIGVLSPGFPLSGSLFAGAAIDVYLPLTIDGNNDIGGFMAVIGRLRPGVTAQQARAELASRQAALSIGKWEWMTVLAQHVMPLPDLVTLTARSPMLLLLGGVGCVLLMACANLANLLLVRASGRRREIQVRTALGASAGRLLGQMTAESAVRSRPRLRFAAICSASSRAMP